jgi:hypothetical protein
MGIAEALAQATADLRARCAAPMNIVWDGGINSSTLDPHIPHMLCIMVEGHRIRMFLDRSALIGRGELYEKFLAAAAQQVMLAVNYSQPWDGK